MKKISKVTTASVLSLSMIAPNAVYAQNLNNNEEISINLENKSIILGSKSKVSIQFKEDINSKTITLNQVCYDMPLSTVLTYNEDKKLYEGEINYNKDPEVLNIWEIESIVLNNEENPKTLNQEDLKNMGINLDDYKVTQEILVYDELSLASYKTKASAPVEKLIGDTRYDTSVEISKEGWQNKADKVILVNGQSIADGVTATPLATILDAPILLTEKNSIPDSVKEEIKRLNPSEVIIIGATGVVSADIESQIKAIDNSISINRLGGATRYETSLKIATEIDKYQDVNTVYMANGYKGEVDALTIASKAGSDKQPIILTDINSVPTTTYNWLKNESLDTAYFIGGTHVISNNVITQMNKITSESVSSSNCRISGEDRHETNANVIKKFYPSNNFNSVMVAKSNVLVDALAAGPLAVKKNAPIIITNVDNLSKSQENVLFNKSTDMIYQVGGGIKQSVIDRLAYVLSEHTSSKETIVLDAGHGGTDSGADGVGGILEKNYNLDTTLGTAEYLRSKNYNIILTRENDKTMSLSQRTSYINAINPDIAVSIHYNASNGSGYGTEVFYRYKEQNGGLTKTLANNILSSITEKFSLKNRGAKIRTYVKDGQTYDYMHMIRESKVPTVLVECAFIDNSSDMKLLDTKAKRTEMGTQIGKGIENSLK